MELMPLIKERLHFLTDAAEMAGFLFKNVVPPPAEQLVPKKLDAAKTKEVLAEALNFIQALDTGVKDGALDHEAQENLAKTSAEKLGVKLGDFMMPIRMAVTGSKVSPPLIGSILILGVEKAAERIKRAMSNL